ncbi:ABC transporter permease [Arundinibacter roseus]|uniref:FtsX-like permease family protein n=1 Tax=Arundinibacter roseus TaxID=2070510 RepID=A0A4R4KDD5_9BACT|nr:ABC transporter permease [Arundinibacter roseus]TDB65917.1 FtsX-like permease family protein [Arundinibacter roseus]
MIKNQLKVAWRSLINNGLFSTLNLVGLALGIAIFLYLFLYTKEELSFDTYHQNRDEIYRVGLTATFDGESSEWASVPNIVGPTMSQEIPEIKAFTRLLYHSFGKTAFVNSQEVKFAEKKLYWSDPGLFTIFDIPLVQGNPKTALDAPNKIILSQSTARKYFGDENPVGKLLSVDHDLNVTVSGVYQDFPQNSTLDADLIGSFTTVGWASKNLYWSNASYETYFLLVPNASPRIIEKKINAVLDKHVEKDIQWFRFWLQPLTQVHLYSTHITNSSTTRVGDIQQVKILSALALGILLIACINYMNLATAQSQKRRKEVGMNKVLGASQFFLIRRFYVEAFLMVTAAIGLGILLLLAFLPIFNSLADKNITFEALLTMPVLAGIALATVTLSLIAGSYPALMLSSFSALSLFGRGGRSDLSAARIRKGLVVIQFAASIVLLISTFVFYRQLQYVQEKNLGYSPEQVISISTQGAQKVEQITSLIDYCKGLSFVQEISRAQAYPGIGASGRTLSKAGENSETGLAIQTSRATPEILKTLNIKLLAGKTFPEKTSETDTTVQVVLNKTAVDFLGVSPEEAIGKTAYNLFGYNQATIVGVMEDFHFDSFHRPIGAYAFHNSPTEGRPNLLVRFQGGKLSENIATLEKGFKQHIPDSAFDYVFLDDVVAKLYESEQRTANLVLFFSIVAILIACLGLFGLAAFTTEQRTKEIGVRKVLGAGIPGLVGLLSGDFLKLVFVALLLAAPVAWYMLDGWLKNYAYHIDMPIWVFPLTGLLALFIAFLTVSYQSIKAALMNPVKSLRSE